MKQGYIFPEDIIMSKIKKLAVLLLAVLLIFPHAVFQSAAQQIEIPEVSAQSAVLIEAESGRLVLAKNEDIRLPIASTTKIMTAITALELASPDTQIPIAAEAVGIEGSSIYLTQNETLTLEQLLYALLLESANDAATAIAIGLCGSVDAFALQMNHIAEKLELKNTHFVNPHGLDAEAHYSSAYDLATLTQYAMKNKLFKAIVSTRKATIPHNELENGRLLVNHNKLLRLYDGCIGVKTGYTKRSGRCLVSAAQRDGVELIAVTLNAPNDWNDHTKMLDYGFSRYCSVLVAEQETISHLIPVTGGTQTEITLCNVEELKMTLPVTHGKIRTTIEAPRFAYAPISAGEPLGTAVFFCDTDGDGTEERIGELQLIACNTVTKLPKKGFWQWLKSLFAWN